jgi:hypothetical protein
MRSAIHPRIHLGVVLLMGCSPALQQPQKQLPSSVPTQPAEAQAKPPQPSAEASEECAARDAGSIMQSRVVAKVAPGTSPFAVYAVGLDRSCRARVDVTLAGGRITGIGQNAKATFDHTYGGDGTSTKKRQPDFVVSGPDGSHFALLARGKCLKSSGDCVSWELVALDRVSKRFSVVGQTGDQADGRISLQIQIPPQMRLRLGEEVLDIGTIEQPIQK